MLQTLQLLKVSCPPSLFVTHQITASWGQQWSPLLKKVVLNVGWHAGFLITHDLEAGTVLAEVERDAIYWSKDKQGLQLLLLRSALKLDIHHERLMQIVRMSLGGIAAPIATNKPLLGRSKHPLPLLYPSSWDDKSFKMLR